MYQVPHKYQVLDRCQAPSTKYQVTDGFDGPYEYDIDETILFCFDGLTVSGRDWWKVEGEEGWGGGLWWKAEAEVEGWARAEQGQARLSKGRKIQMLFHRWNFSDCCSHLPFNLITLSVQARTVRARLVGLVRAGMKQWKSVAFSKVIDCRIW